MSTALFAGFGLLWTVTGVIEFLLPWSSMYLVVTVASLLITAAGSLPNLTRNESQRAKRMLFAVTIVQGVSIPTAAVILALVHLPEYINPAIAIIVGLHLLPLAAVNRSEVDKITSGLLLAWCGGCMTLLARNRIAAATALGTGCIMLAGIFLHRTERPMEDVAPGTPPGS